MTIIRRLTRLPAVYFLLLVIAGGAAQRVFPVSLGMPTFRAAAIAGSALLLTGFAIAAAGITRMRNERTTIEPGERPTALVTRGVFSWSRNPLYVGLLLVHAGIAVALDSPWLLGTVVLLWVALDRLIVPDEERMLQEMFGSTYLAYRERVRRWI